MLTLPTVVAFSLPVMRWIITSLVEIVVWVAVGEYAATTACCARAAKLLVLTSHTCGSLVVYGSSPHMTTTLPPRFIAVWSSTQLKCASVMLYTNQSAPGVVVEVVDVEVVVVEVVVVAAAVYVTGVLSV